MKFTYTADDSARTEFANESDERELCSTPKRAKIRRSTLGFRGEGERR